jgi:alpha-mannosidase
MERVMALLDDEAIRRYKVRIRHLTSTDFAFVAEEVPGYGYKTYRVVRGKLREPLLPLATCNSQFAIRNEFFAIEVDPSDGTLAIEDKATGMVFEGMNRFVNGGDRGDEYNYCVPEDDLIIESPSSPPIIEIIERGPIRQTIEVRMKYHLPEALAEDRRSRSDKMVEVPIRSRISIYKGVRRIDFSTVVENRAKDHRLRVHFPTQIESDCSWAEGSFDVIRRQIGIPIDTAEWIEQPTPTHPQRTFVDVNDGEKGLMVINKGLPEYEVIKEKGQLTIALTLLRCVGWLSRDDLTSRRGHAGPGVETPEAQCLGVYTFDYAILPHLGDWREAFREAHAFNAQLRAVPTDVHTGTLPPELSFVELEPESLVISAIKAAEEGDGLIVRFYNIGDDDVEGRLRLYRQFHKAALVNMKEEEIEVLGEDDKEIALEVRGKQIVTLRFEF